MFTIYEILYVTVGNSAFCLPFYLASLHFWGELQHFGLVREQKIKRWPIRTREIADIKLQNKLFNDYMIINLYHWNSQPTSTSSKFNIKNSRTRSKICSKLKRKTPERHQLTVCSCQLKSVFLFNFGHISDRFLVFFVLSLNK